MIDSLCRPPRPPTDFRRSSSILSSRAKIGHGGMGSGDRSLLGRGERGSHYVLPSLRPFPLLIHSLLRRLAGMFLDASRAVVPRNQAASFLYSDPPMRQIKTRTAPRRSWIIPSRAPSQPRSMGRCRRIVFRHPGAAAAAGRLRRESRSPRRRLLDR